MSDTVSPDKVSSYMQYLPAVFQEADNRLGFSFLGRFLLAFEHILSGLEDTEPPGIEQTVDGIDAYFDPMLTPNKFLAWLASWVALTLRADWTEPEQRRFIAGIIPLYRLRGTKAGLIGMVNTYTKFNVEMHELPFQVGVISTVGKDSLIGGVLPHHFYIKMILQQREGSEFLKEFERKKQIALAIVKQEKPAHTYFSWLFETPTMTIGVYSTVGIDTFLGG